MYPFYRKQRKSVASLMRRVYERGLTTASGGNISLREGNLIFITPSGTDKGLIRPQQVAVMTPDGGNLTPALKPSMETGMHLSIYRLRPDVNAVVHAHPVFSSAFCATGKTINCRLIGESRAVIGTPALAGYALMGTRELAMSVAEAARESNVILLKNHGVVCLGKTLLQAFDRMEVLEAAARMTVIANLTGDVCEMSDADLSDIDRLFGELK